MADHGHTHDDGAVHVHVHSTKFYAGVLFALLCFTVLTVAVSYLDVDAFLALGEPVRGVGAWNLTIAIVIATMKASLVVLFFMHLKDDSRFNALVFVGSLLFVGIFFAYTLNDTAVRGTMDPYNGVRIDPVTGERAPGGIPGPIHGEAMDEGPASGPEAVADEMAAEAASETGTAEETPQTTPGGGVVEHEVPAAAPQAAEGDLAQPGEGAPEAAPAPTPAPTEVQAAEGAAPAEAAPEAAQPAAPARPAAPAQPEAAARPAAPTQPAQPAPAE